MRAGFGTKLAWIAQRDQPVVLIGRDDDDARRAVALGITNIAGYLTGGMTSWREEKRATESVPRIDVEALHERAGDVQILDVRERSEWDAGHIPGSIHAPYHDIDGAPDGIDASRPIAVICSSGQRSAVAATLLLRDGAEQVVHIADGGVGMWHKNGWPIEQPMTAGARA